MPRDTPALCERMVVRMDKKIAVKSKMTAFLKGSSLFILLIVFIVIASFLSPSFLSLQNIINLWQRSSVAGIVAIGMTFVILLGGIDLSVGSVVALSGVMVALMVTHGVPIPLAILLSMLAGGAWGLLGGLLITKFNLPDFIVTMAMMTSARGFALLITNGTPVFNLPKNFQVLGQGLFLHMPISGLIWIILTLLAFLLLKYTSYGRSLFSIGGNREAAYLSGIRVKLIYTSAYVISGILSAFSGVILASWLATGQPTEGSGMELNAIAAVVVGGTSLSGGTGGVIGSFGGVILLAIITNIFNLMGLSSYYQSIFSGVIIVGALLLNLVILKKKA